MSTLISQVATTTGLGAYCFLGGSAVSLPPNPIYHPDDFPRRVSYLDTVQDRNAVAMEKVALSLTQEWICTKDLHIKEGVEHVLSPMDCVGILEDSEVIQPNATIRVRGKVRNVISGLDLIGDAEDVDLLMYDW